MSDLYTESSKIYNSLLEAKAELIEKMDELDDIIATVDEYGEEYLQATNDYSDLTNDLDYLNRRIYTMEQAAI